MSFPDSEEVFTTWTSDVEGHDISVVFLCGELDASSVPGFLSDMQQVIDLKKHVIMDVHLLEYVDSTGVGAILSLGNVLRDGGMQLRLVGCHGLLTRILQMIQIDREICCLEDIDAAVADILGSVAKA